eukprot:4844428-Lingulodinium_polyedra.AAC.1
MFDGVLYSEPEFPAALFGGRVRSDAEGPALDIIDPYLDSVIEEEIAHFSSAKAGGFAKTEQLPEEGTGEYRGAAGEEIIHEPGEAAMHTATTMRDIITKMESCV